MLCGVWMRFDSNAVAVSEVGSNLYGFDGRVFVSSSKVFSLKSSFKKVYEFYSLMR